jgi:hypothetical protein
MGKLRPIAANVGHLMGDDQMMFDIDRDLDILASSIARLILNDAAYSTVSAVREARCSLANSALNNRVRQIYYPSKLRFLRIG